MLREFRGPYVGFDQQRSVGRDGLVHAPKDRGGDLGRNADDDPIGEQGIVECVTLPEELRVAGDVEVKVRCFQGDGGADALGGPGRHGGLLHHDDAIVCVTGDLRGGLLHRMEVGLPILTHRCADADEDDRRSRQSVGRTRGEPQTSPVELAVQRAVQIRLVERRHPALEERDLLLIDVEPDDLVPHPGERHTADEPDVPRANDRDVHRSFPDSFGWWYLVSTSVGSRPWPADPRWGYFPYAHRRSGTREGVPAVGRLGASSFDPWHSRRYAVSTQRGRVLKPDRRAWSE
jgi:hypothetical protein